MPRLSLLVIAAVGLSLASAESQRCQVGYYSSTGFEPCTVTNPGYVASAPGQHPTPRACLPGTYQPEAGKGFCLKSPPGHYVPSSGASVAIKCPVGTSQANEGASACTPCGYDRYSSVAGAVHCAKCPRGRIPSPGASGCVPAPVGGRRALSMAGPGADYFSLVLDDAATPWVWGYSSVFGPSGSGNFPVPTPLAGIALHTSLSGVIGVPATPAGTTVVAVSAGYENGCLLYSDTSAGCFGDVGNANAYSNFVGTGGYVTDGSGNVVTGITQIVAAPGQNGGILLLRNDVTSGFAGVVTYLYDIKSPVPGVNSAVDGNFNVIDPLNPSVALQGAILVAQGTDQSCAFMGEQYKQPNAVVCFSFGTHGNVKYLGAKLTLDSGSYSNGPSLISVDGSSYIQAKDISVGSGQACATVSGLEVVCWGFLDSLSQLAGAAIESVTVTLLDTAYGGKVSTTTFVDLYVQSVSCGAVHTCVLLNDEINGLGVVRCWGGDGTAGSTASSVYNLNQDVLYSSDGTALTGVTSISSGFFATCVTRGIDDAVTCWGDDSKFQLGDGAGGVGVGNTGPASGASTFTQLYPAGVIA